VNRIAIRAHEIPGAGIAPMLRTFMEDVMPLIAKQIAQPA
jgi:hypothetical protein